MRQLNHTLFVTEEDMELHLRGEALEACRNGIREAHIPLHNLEGIVTMSFKPATPALMSACAEKGISFIVLNQKGKLRYKVIGRTRGNPELRILQYHLTESESDSLPIARRMICAKIRNGEAVLRRYARNHPELRIPIHNATEKMSQRVSEAETAASRVILRGLEAEAAQVYFSALSMAVCPQDADIFFDGRNRRPPSDPVNALLSFSYTLLANQCQSGLEAVGLDPFMGVLHTIKSGHAALAYDLMEELRPIMADRFVLRLLNLNILDSRHFNITDDAVLLTKEGLKVFFIEWQRMQKTLVLANPEEGKIEMGLLPYCQAQQLSRYIYGNIGEYRPFLTED